MTATARAWCQACGVAEVGDLAVHALWHARLEVAVPTVAAPVTTTDPTTGVPVAAVMPAAEVEDESRAATLRAQAEAAIGRITGEAIPALDAYLAIATPDAGQVRDQVRTLTRIVRGLALAVRALIRLVIRALDAVD